MDERIEIKKIIKGLALLLALLAACAVTKGWALLPVAIFAVWCAVTGKRGLTLLAFAYLPLHCQKRRALPAQDAVTQLCLMNLYLTVCI